MGPDEMDELLLSMLDDARLSRAERKALRSLVQERGLDAERLAVFRSRAFDLARRSVPPEHVAVIEWLEGAVKSLLPPTHGPSAEHVARFSPGMECLNAIVGEFRRSTKTADVCVFTITDDRIVDAMPKAHQRGVKVRVISDDEKSTDTGSDVARIAKAGLDVRTDSSPSHMHHKFAVFDNERVVTGSYNWTRSAAAHNHENLIISDDDELVLAFSKTFTRLWDRFGETPHRER